MAVAPALGSRARHRRRHDSTLNSGRVNAPGAARAFEPLATASLPPWRLGLVSQKSEEGDERQERRRYKRQPAHRRQGRGDTSVGARPAPAADMKWPQLPHPDDARTPSLPSESVPTIDDGACPENPRHVASHHIGDIVYPEVQPGEPDQQDQQERAHCSSYTLPAMQDPPAAVSEEAVERGRHHRMPGWKSILLAKHDAFHGLWSWPANEMFQRTIEQLRATPHE
jgi:hypothetical protein